MTAGGSLDLVTLGRANMDLYAREIGVEFADVSGFEAMVGGSPTNIAIASSRLGLRAAALTAVGDDLVGEFCLRYLRDEGVVTDHIAEKPGKKTSLALLGVQPPDHFPLAFYRDDPADIHLTVGDVASVPLTEVGSVVLSGNAFSRGACADTARWVAERVADAPASTTYLDMDLRPTEWRHPESYGLVLRSVMRHIDVVIGTEEELDAALDPGPRASLDHEPIDRDHRRVLEERVDELLTLGPTAVVVKRGARGVTIVTAGDRTDVPGYPVEVVNTVGAGDAFAAGLVWARHQGRPWQEAASFANACGAIEVTRHGCSSAFPTLGEVEAFLAERSGG